MDWADPDMILDFTVEAEEHLDHADALLLELEKRPDDAKLLVKVTGHFHTLKGMAGYVDFGEMQRLCHLLESALDRRHGPLTPARVDIAFEAVSVLRRRLEQLSACVEDGGDLPHSATVEALIAALEQLAKPQQRPA